MQLEMRSDFCFKGVRAKNQELDQNLGRLSWERKTYTKMDQTRFFLFGTKKKMVRPTLMHTKNLYENGPNPFFSGFFNLMGTRMVQIRMAKSV